MDQVKLWTAFKKLKGYGLLKGLPANFTSNIKRINQLLFSLES